MGEHHRQGYLKAQEHMEDCRKRQHETAVCRYTANPKHCPNCDVIIPYEARHLRDFCGRSCAAQHNNKHKVSRAKKLPQCACGQAVGSRHNKWCDSCIAAGRAGRTKVWCLEDAKQDKSRRAYLLRTRPHQCQYPGCGITEWLGAPTPLEMDHVDGDSDNNTEENLRLVCPNCHALTPTHKGKNRGNGRTRQRIKNQRYADGLTY